MEAYISPSPRYIKESANLRIKSTKTEENKILIKRGSSKSLQKRPEEMESGGPLKGGSSRTEVAAMEKDSPWSLPVKLLILAGFGESSQANTCCVWPQTIGAL